MSRKRRPGRPKGSTSKKRSQNAENFTPINPDTLREIVAIILFVVAFIILVSFVGFGGSLGNALITNLRLIVGWTTYVLPIILGLLGYALFRTEIPFSKVTTYLGITLFITSLSGIFQIFLPPDNALEIAKVGNGGGYLGVFVQKLMLILLNAPVSFVVLTAFAIIGILLATNVSLREIFRRKEREEKATLKNDIKIHETTPLKNALSGLRKQPVADKVETPTMTVGDTSGWEYPSTDLLEEMTTRADSGNIRENAATIQKTLSNFSIEVNMTDVNVGPTVTQYTLKPTDGVKLEKITGLDKNLALSLAAHPIRIEAPIPGKSLVGIEVPNKKPQIVRMRNIIESETFKNRKSSLSVILGLDVAGHPQIADITKMPHLLIAGSTGSGKSVCINAILTSLLYQNSPNKLKMILVDPKRVELSLYNDMPHLLTPVIVEADKTVSALKWAVAEMEHRYRILQQAGKRNVNDYNETKGKEAMPYIIVVVDELADLMAVSANEVEALICRLAQMARAVGIHLIVATQRPSVDVITGLIKANITTRIAFAVASNADSRTILDQGGAEKLLGNGDMLFVSAEISKPRRIQGAFVSEKEVRSITDFIKAQDKPEYNEEILLQNARAGTGSDGYGAVDDELFIDAADCVIRAGKASASLLQRRLRIGYARAARLLDLLEERGVVGPADGARPRDVLVEDVNDVITETEFEEE
ncbi:MAG: DNA translocase FtsK 4TM domain-containing protein [Patescibacteria group bacterium]|nr:DNA translocase FtsK 4TM domain-containing protein [Patescibacteria group bacterium]